MHDETLLQPRNLKSVRWDQDDAVVSSEIDGFQWLVTWMAVEDHDVLLTHSWLGKFSEMLEPICKKIFIDPARWTCKSDAVWRCSLRKPIVHVLGWKIKRWGMCVLAALKQQIIAIVFPCSPLVSFPICFIPFTAIILSGWCTETSPDSSTFQILLACVSCFCSSIFRMLQNWLTASWLNPIAWLILVGSGLLTLISGWRLQNDGNRSSTAICVLCENGCRILFSLPAGMQCAKLLQTSVRISLCISLMWFTNCSSELGFRTGHWPAKFPTFLTLPWICLRFVLRFWRYIN